LSDCSALYHVFPIFFVSGVLSSAVSGVSSPRPLDPRLHWSASHGSACKGPRPVESRLGRVWIRSPPAARVVLVASSMARASCERRIACQLPRQRRRSRSEDEALPVSERPHCARPAAREGRRARRDLSRGGGGGEPQTPCGRVGQAPECQHRPRLSTYHPWKGYSDAEIPTRAYRLSPTGYECT
jgi:hypothetical protein